MLVSKAHTGQVYFMFLRLLGTVLDAVWASSCAALDSIVTLDGLSDEAGSSSLSSKRSCSFVA